MTPEPAKQQPPAARPARSEWYAAAMEQLVDVVQDISRAHDLDSLMFVVRNAARSLTGADGASFVLRDGDNCFYADENAVSPLWKGKRFPLKTCVSGWVMLNAVPAVIEDIYVDARIPAAAYRPTFVKSLAMVPIRKENPVGAIGNYWGVIRKPSEEEVAILQALANVTAVAIENIGLDAKLKQKLHALEETNAQLKMFAWIASHDLRSPLRSIANLAQWAEDDAEPALAEASKAHLAQLRQRVKRLDKMLDDLREYSLLEHADAGGWTGLDADMTDAFELVTSVRGLVDLPPGFTLEISPRLKGIPLPRYPFERVFVNLLTNAVRHHDKTSGKIEVTVAEDEGNYVIGVKDDGPGIPAAHQEKVFEMFQTLKPRDQREGSGMGLTIVRKILARYGSAISLSSQGRGTVFSFAWPKSIETPAVQKAG